MRRLMLIGACVCILAVMPGCGQDDLLTVVVEAGDYDRRHTVVAFDLPDSLRAASLVLVDHAGDRIPVQVGEDGMARFVLPACPAGESRSFRLRRSGDALAPGVEAVVEGGEVALRVRGEPVTRYHVEAGELPRPDVDSLYLRGGYLHPVRTPSGQIVTDDYPPNHVHHHGIWAAWTNTVYEGRTPDFWNMGAGTGTVEVEELEANWSGPVHGGLRARHRYVDLSAPEPETVLHETWTVTVYDIPGDEEQPYRLIDLDLVQRMAGDSALVLPEYRYGGVGFRGRREWDGPENAYFLTSEGRDRSDGHATRARWCHIGGRIGGALAGVAVLGHPDNFEAPQPMRIHPNEPFFNYAPSQAGDWSIEPGEPYEARYRFVVYDGEPDPERLDALWNDYAHPPTVRVEG